jgi:hypothetical protein
LLAAQAYLDQASEDGDGAEGKTDSSISTHLGVDVRESENLVELVDVQIR